MSSARRKSNAASCPDSRFPAAPRARDRETLAYEVVRKLVEEGISGTLFPDDIREAARTISGSSDESALSELRRRIAAEADLFSPGTRERATAEKRTLARELLDGVFAPFEGSLEGEAAAGAALPGTVTEIVLHASDAKSVEIALLNARIDFRVEEPRTGETERLMLAVERSKPIRARTRLDVREGASPELVLVRIVGHRGAGKRRT